VQKPDVDKMQSLGAGLNAIVETITKFKGRGDASTSRAIIGGRSKSALCRWMDSWN